MDRFFRLAPSCAVLICVLAALPGCSTLKETSVWKKTSGLYYTYVNRPIKLDLTSAEALPEGESRLASRLMSLDWQLTSLERTMEALGPVSDQNTADMLLRRFPWLSSVVILDADANVFMSVPSIQLKQLDYTPLLTVPPKISLPSESERTFDRLSEKLTPKSHFTVLLMIRESSWTSTPELRIDPILRNAVV